MKHLPAHPMLHPLTHTPVRPLGFRSDGRPIWPVLGGDGTNPDPIPAGQPAPPQPPAPPAPQPPTPPVPTPPAPNPATVWPPQQQPAQAQPPTFVAPPPGQQPPPSDADNFPANTPVAEMTAPQQIAYWKHQSRRHEDRVKAMPDYDDLKATAEKYQQLVAASQTETERAVAEARRQGRTEALNEAGSQLVDQWLRAAAAGRIPDESVNALLLGLDRAKFLNQNGGVDTDKVYAFVGSIAPAAAPAAVVPPGTVQPPAPQVPAPLVAAPPRAPDFGQGQPTTPPKNGLDAGRERARARFAPKTAPAQ